MEYNTHKHHPDHRYGNVLTLLKDLYELEYFTTDSNSPGKWETGKQELAKLSDEEFESLGEILKTMYLIVHNIKTDTSSQTNQFINKFLEEVKGLKKEV